MPGRHSSGSPTPNTVVEALSPPLHMWGTPPGLQSQTSPTSGSAGTPQGTIAESLTGGAAMVSVGQSQFPAVTPEAFLTSPPVIQPDCIRELSVLPPDNLSVMTRDDGTLSAGGGGSWAPPSSDEEELDTSCTKRARRLH